MRKKHIFSTVVAVSMLVLSSVTHAVTADNVICTGCVQSSDIADRAVTTKQIGLQAVNTARIADRAVTTKQIGLQAVTTGKIADGAVTETKLSAAVQAKLNATGGVPTANRPTVTATQQVYALLGDFRQSDGPAICQSAGPDTEVRTITRTTVTGGTRINITRQRFNGGTGGTSCHYHKITSFDNGEALVLAKREKYDVSGSTLLETDIFNEFDEIQCNDCGIANRYDGMGEGLISTWGGLESGTDNTTSTSLGASLGLNVISLQEINQTQSINVGELNEETFTGCNSYLEDRTTTFFGEFKTYRVICPTVGRIQEYRRTVDGKGQSWELTSYTAP